MVGIKHTSFRTPQIDELFRKPCCRKRVGRGKSLDIGFGEKIFHKKNLIDDFYGEWEVGGYSSSWRVIQGESIICGSQDAVSSIDELNKRINTIDFGGIQTLVMASKYDIRLVFDNGVSLEFICASADDDEMFGIFGPEKFYLGYNPISGWLMGKSNEPSENLVRVETEVRGL